MEPSRRAQGEVEGVQAPLDASATRSHSVIDDTDATNQQEIAPLLGHLRTEPQPSSPPQQGRGACLAYFLFTACLCALSSFGTRIYITRASPQIPVSTRYSPTGADSWPVPPRVGNGTHARPSEPAPTKPVPQTPDNPKHPETFVESPVRVDDIYSKQARGAVPNVGWYPSAQCEEMLMLTQPTIGQRTFCGAHNVTTRPLIELIDVQGMDWTAAGEVTGRAPMNLEAMVRVRNEQDRSPRDHCADIVRAALDGTTKPDGRRVIIPTVTSPLPGGVHGVSGRVLKEGTYTLMVFTEWANFFPDHSCRRTYDTKTCWQPFEHMLTIKVNVLPPVASSSSTSAEAPASPGKRWLKSKSKSKVKPSTSATKKADATSTPVADSAAVSKGVEWLESRPICRDLASMHHGQWVVDDRALSAFYGRRNGYMSGLRMHWLPYDCIIPAYSTQELRQALRDKTFFFFGDSTMFEFMLGFLNMVGLPWEDCKQEGHPCTRDARYLDSKDHFGGIRIRFSWAGSANPNENGGSLVKMLASKPVVDRWVGAMGRDPDLVFVNAGLHEALVTPGPRDLEEYEAGIEGMIKLVLEHTDGRLARRPGENRTPRIVYKTSLPQLGDYNCHGHRWKKDDERLYAANGAVSWMNYLAERKMKELGVEFHDVARLVHSDEYTKPYFKAPGDKIHCGGRPSCYFQALILLHHTVLTLAAETRG